MLSLPIYGSDGDGTVTIYYGSGVCLSTDNKPIGNVENGTKLIEMDTGKIYMYDAENGDWKEFA